MANIDYLDFAIRVHEMLQEERHWEASYSKYVEGILKNQPAYIDARRRFEVKPPLQCYLRIGVLKEDSKEPTFNLRYMGQSVADVTVSPDGAFLSVTEQQAENNKRFYREHEKAESTAIDREPLAGIHAKGFFAHFAGADRSLHPRQDEHRVEDALYAELEKKTSEDKSLLWIQPVNFTGSSDIRVHMKTALSGCRAKDDDVYVSDPGHGGEIDLFCRKRHGNRSRLTVIEVKDKNETGERYELAVKQAVAYSVFILNLIRSSSGEQWMRLWGMGNQPWQDGVTINAVAAMPAGTNDDFSFGKQRLAIGKAHGCEYLHPNDCIELHYIALDDKKTNEVTVGETSLV